MSSRCPHNMVNFGLLAAEIVSLVWGTPANFNGFRVLAALLHGTPLLGVSQTLRRRTEGATYIRQGGHHVGHWPTFLVVYAIDFSIGFCAHTDDLLLKAVLSNSFLLNYFACVLLYQLYLRNICRMLCTRIVRIVAYICGYSYDKTVR